jgi:hypothetical protein
MMGGTQTPVNGVAGPLFSISSATTASANLTTSVGAGPTTAGSPLFTTINAGSMNQTVWRNNVSIGTNPAKLNGVTFKMIGSAPANTLSNVQIYVDGVSKGTATINSNMQFVFNMMGAPVMLNTGSHLIELRADVVAGSYRNFYISLENAADLMIEDSTLPGINITPSYLSGTLTNIFGGQVTINQGSLTVTQDSTFNNITTLVGGAAQTVLASYKFTAYGEDVKVTSLSITANGSGFSPATTTGFANTGIFVNGGQIGSSQTMSLLAGNSTPFNGLGSNLYIPAGQSVIVQIKGDTSNPSAKRSMPQFRANTGIA